MNDLFKARQYGIAIGEKTDKSLTEILKLIQPSVVYVENAQRRKEAGAFNLGSFYPGVIVVNTKPTKALIRTEGQPIDYQLVLALLDELEDNGKTDFYFFNGTVEELLGQIIGEQKNMS